MEKTAFEVRGSAEEIVVAMLDCEADKSLPDEVRAGAMFFRLIMPSFEEALDRVSRRHGFMIANECLGVWMGTLTAGTLLEQIPTAPYEFKERVAKFAVKDFERAFTQQLEGHKKKPHRRSDGA